MDTTAETFVGTGDDDEGLLALLRQCFGFGFFEYGVGGLAIFSGLGHCFLSSGEFGGSDDFHGLCDFFDVADGFEAAFDLTESGIVGSIGGDSPMYSDVSTQAITSNGVSRARLELLGVPAVVRLDAYRVVAAAPALRTGRAVREIMLTTSYEAENVHCRNWPRKGIIRQ